MIQKILVANRGEIALRIMKTIREMGLQSVAVFSDADHNAPFVKYADEAINIGPAPSSESYLVIDKIINACKITGADAIHPGYGFLSENAGFKEALDKAGITFIGPSAEAINLMGSKLAAKDAVKKYGVPMVPGTDEAITDVQAAKKTAESIGFPILIKASAGGGGKGMRIVEKAEDFESQMDRAVSEAESSFGDGAVFIEKFVTKPRHIEIQVLADQHGNVVHLFERECSIQRRHQKVIEEAPSSVLTEELRQKMGEAAVNVAKSCNYEGAGTVEFLLDGDLNFYFLEMNTRLQVEHPVTEMITGTDLVREQIQIAEGKPLSFKQEDLTINGHSIEVRVYAEDPANNFLPDIGVLKVYKRPVGKGIRVDDGFEEGMEVPIHYDPMISKLIVHDENRAKAIDKMIRAIDNYAIGGIATTMSFCKYALDSKPFRSGDFDTKFVDNHFKNPEVISQKNEAMDQVAAFAAKLFIREELEKEKKPISQSSKWFEQRKWSE